MPKRTSAKPSLTQVATALGLSTATVSHAFNRPDRLSPATRARVLAMAETMGYSGPDPAAWERTRLRCSWARWSAGMCLVASAPNPVDTP